MLGTPIGRLRFIGFVEGISLLVLLLVAMPLKYVGGMPLPNKIVGWTHGVLFILFLAAAADAATRRGWWSGSFWGKAFLAALLPCGTFVFDRWLKRQEGADTPATSKS
jgi:integral membrane protein